jgi:hypothetical protein
VRAKRENHPIQATNVSILNHQTARHSKVEEKYRSVEASE